MKKTIITATLLAMLGAFAVSCQKEADTAPPTVYSQSEYNLLYRIDNVVHYANIQSPEEWNTFLSDMLALARQGHRVSVQRTSTSSLTLPAKEVVTHETKDPDEVIAWFNMMTEQGYEVIIKFDEETGIYTLTAIKP
jgi:hypothetical protein